MDKVYQLLLTCTLVFLIAPAFLLVYTTVYNRRKKRHIAEKAQMHLAFDEEIARTQTEIREQIMQTVGADLHDNIGQLLSLASVTLSSLGTNDDQPGAQKIGTAADLVSTAIRELRQLGKLLQGDPVARLGLCQAIMQSVEWMEKSGKYTLFYTHDWHPAETDPGKELIVFRIFQETVANIIKHAAATEINITLAWAGGQLQLMITDNGIGFDEKDAAASSNGMGLQNMYKRAEILQGSFSITGSAGGSCTELLIPYP